VDVFLTAFVGVAGIIATLIAVRLSNRHAEKLAHSSHWFDKRFEAYSSGLRATLAIARISDEWWLSLSGHESFTDSYNSRMNAEFLQAKGVVEELSQLGGFTVSETAAACLLGLVKHINSSDDPEPEFMDSQAKVARECHRVLMSEARLDLGLMPKTAPNGTASVA
jgi:hypothetical protein